jgi:predicted RNase H-like nuclease (RuvC/YqgF family)
MKKVPARTTQPPVKAKRHGQGSTDNAKRMAALQARLEELECKIQDLELRNEALDHSIEELAAAWVADQK